jgi:hypothetical protein
MQNNYEKIDTSETAVHVAGHICPCSVYNIFIFSSIISLIILNYIAITEGEIYLTYICIVWSVLLYILNINMSMLCVFISIVIFISVSFHISIPYSLRGIHDITVWLNTTLIHK